jgi:hypothetical protein
VATRGAPPTLPMGHAYGLPSVLQPSTRRNGQAHGGAGAWQRPARQQHQLRRNTQYGSLLTTTYPLGGGGSTVNLINNFRRSSSRALAARGKPARPGAVGASPLGLHRHPPPTRSHHGWYRPGGWDPAAIAARPRKLEKWTIAPRASMCGVELNSGTMTFGAERLRAGRAPVTRLVHRGGRRWPDTADVWQGVGGDHRPLVRQPARRGHRAGGGGHQGPLPGG